MGRFDDYKFRCSSLGKIVSKSGKLTDTTKTYLNELFIQEVYGVRKEVRTKYFEKGVFEEESGITLLNQTLHPGKLLLKNKERKSNEYIHGEADCIVDGIVYDIKNAWDLFTFAKAGLSHDYYWQLVGYMMLWELDKARLFYCLNNTPDHILIDEEKRLFWNNQHIYTTMESPDYLRACTELRILHNYDSMPVEERFKVWDVPFSLDSWIEIKASVRQARGCLNELDAERNSHLQRNRDVMRGCNSVTILHTPIDEGKIVEVV